MTSSEALSDPFDVVILGFGFTGRAVAERARREGRSVCGTVRSAARAATLREAGFEVVRADHLDAALIAPLVGARTHVVVAFPPDGSTERAILPALRAAAAVTFISSTSVYGATVGRIDDATPVPPDASGSSRLAAEALFREIGATTLRCPGIYGPARGLHVRVLSGQHKIPGDGSRATSRIHVVDLAAFVAATRTVSGETFVVGDLSPGPHVEVVRWIAETYGVPMPPSVPIESVHESLRGDRRIDPARALSTLGVTLAFPTYQAGMSPEATGLAARPPRPSS